MTEELIYHRPNAVTGWEAAFCPGCGHGLVAKVVAEALDDMNLQADAIFIGGVGCHGMCGGIIDVDWISALHGRAPAVAAGIKRGLGGKGLVVTLQGDGDLAAIGLGDILSAVNRGEKLTTIFFNNADYGTTGGQMAPTTLVGQITTTTPNGRDPEQTGYPVHMAELMASMRGVAYAARCALNNLKNYLQAKKAVKTAFQKQLDGVGYSFVEMLSACPAGWNKSPAQALNWLEGSMMKEYSLGEFKNIEKTS